MKVKIIKRIESKDLQDDVNDFIKHVGVIDIKYTTPYDQTGRRTHYSAMIMYKEN